MSKTQTRLHELPNRLVVLEADIDEAAEFAEAYFLQHGSMD